MINTFTTEATQVVYETISNEPDLFEQAVTLVTNCPAAAPQELRSWVEERVTQGSVALKNDLTKELVRTSLNQVRWAELRQVLQRDAKKYHA